MHREIPKPLSVARPVGSQAGAVLGAYFSLTKPRIISLLLLITLVVLMIAGGKAPPLLLSLSTLVGGALMSGAANVLNCYLDRDIDGIMSRTRNRPLVTGIISPAHALVFGFVLAALAFVVLAVGANVLSAALAFAGLLVYVLLYTPSKRTTPASVVIGAIAGAAPPLVAWAAVRGSLDLTAWILFAIMAAWQIPHTLALTLMLYNDYARAGVPVSPVAHGIRTTQREIIAYSLLLWALTLLPGILGFFGWVYGLGALMLGGQFVVLAFDGLFPTGARRTGARVDMRLYKYSLLYLALLFTLMTADRLLRVLWRG